MPGRATPVSERQWGRGRMAAEGSAAVFSTGPGAFASMGPRPDGRGRPDHDQDRNRRDHASMGPRPDGRGRGYSLASAARCMTCVNGAAAGWPRKAATSQHLSRRVAVRQWGRGRMAAEGSPPRPTTPAPRASMGPRPDGRGRGAEGCRPARAGRRVNGAAAGWPRKGAPAFNVWPPHVWRQWGRGRMAAEGTHGPHWMLLHVTCVNGAAAGWPRKACSTDDLEPIVSRQWGRGRMAAEGRGH